MPPGGVALLVFLVSVAAGCQSPEEASRAYLANGDRYFAAKKYDEAAIEYRNVVQRTPRSAEGFYKLGEALAAKSDVVGALAAYVRATDLNPDLTDGQIKASQLLLLARKYEDAKTRLRAVLAKEPTNATAVLMLGNALAGLRSFDEAVAATERAVALDPKRAGTYMNLGAMRYLSGDKVQSEAAYLAGVKAEPLSLEAHLGLADFYWLENRLQQSEQAYLEALKLDASNLRANRAVADFYIRADRGAQAEQYLKKVAQAAKSPADWYALADYYVAMGRHKPALDVLVGLRKQRPTYVEASIRIAFLARLDNRPAQANQVLDEVLKNAPRNVRALALKAHLLLDSRQRQEALAVAERAVSADRTSEAAHLAYASAAVQNGLRDLAKNEFLEVLKLNPTSTEAMIELAQVHLDQNLVDTALQFAEQAVKVSPDLVEAKLMRLRVMANHSERRDDAARELSALLTRYPKSAEVQYEAGLVAVKRKDSAAAYRYFQRARELKPEYIRPLTEFEIKLDIQGKNVAQARRRVDEALAKEPESIDVLLVAGTAYGMIDATVAERYLRKVLKLDPSNITAYEALAAVFLTHNRLDKAREEFVNLAKQQPTDVAPPTMVGIISEAQGDKAEAEKWYQQALKINGRAAAAANNLAWMYAEQGRQLEAAVELAQVAHSELPRRVEVTDTLGWAYLRKGLLAQAVRTFQDVVRQDPNNALYQYHLGLAYAATGEDAQARISLKQALSLDPNFPQAVDAQRALAKLLY